jgi:hypothetical protein
MKNSSKLIFLLVALVSAIFFIRWPARVDTKVNADTLAHETETQESAEKKEENQNPIESLAPIEISSDETNLITMLSSQDITSARQEAKSILSNAYGSEEWFFNENNRYTSDFFLAGITPRNSLMVFKFGFINELHSDQILQGENPENKDSDIYLKAKADLTTNFQYSDLAKEIQLSQFLQYCENFCEVRNDSFELLLVIPFGPNQYDIWRINNRKELVHVKDGTK